VENLVVDAASIEVHRRAKRAKTDRLDVGKLVAMWMRYHQGEKKVWSVVHIPSVEAEDERHLRRTLMTLNADRIRHLNRLRGLLSAQGVHLAVGTEFVEELQALRLWDGSPVRAGWLARIKREGVLLKVVEEQIRAVESERREALRSSASASVAQVRQLLRLRAIGENSAWLYVMELFGGRQFHNRREMGGLAGLSPTPYQRGDESHDQGIRKAGNGLIRFMAIEIAWSWVRFQPESALSQWYPARFGQGSKRLRKIGIVAVARKLWIALWRYLVTGEIPAGAPLKA
jgi:transposase